MSLSAARVKVESGTVYNTAGRASYDLNDPSPYILGLTSTDGSPDLSKVKFWLKAGARYGAGAVYKERVADLISARYGTQDPTSGAAIGNRDTIHCTNDGVNNSGLNWTGSNLPDTSFRTTAYTVGAVFKKTGTTYGIALIGATGNYWSVYVDASGYLKIGHAGTVYTSSSAVVTAGTAHILLVTYDSASGLFKAWLDGVEVTFASNAAVSPAGSVTNLDVNAVPGIGSIGVLDVAEVFVLSNSVRDGAFDGGRAAFWQGYGDYYGISVTV